MSYTRDDETVFCTLAIGEFYREVINNQIQSVLKNTHHDLYIMTDEPDTYDQRYYGPRIHYIKFDEKTNLGLELKSKANVFNYNLKLCAIHYVANFVRPTNIIWMDCDTWVFSQFPRNMNSYFDAASPGILATRFRQALSDPDIEQHPIIVEKLKLMGIDRSNINAKLPIENVMVMKNGPALLRFLECWLKFAKLSHESGCTSFFEAVEIALAIEESGIDCKLVNGTTFNFADNFRTLHLNAGNPAKVIHNPYII